MSSNKILAKNAAINLLGQIIPIIAAIVTIPIIIKGLGTERFGILTLAWALTGYFNIFDFGIGRAITKIVSEHLGGNREYDIAAMIGSGVSLITAIGCIAGILLYLFAPNLISLINNLREPLARETLVVVNVLAITIPIVICSSYFRGILEAHQKFKYINFTKMPINVLTYVGPALILNYSNELTYIALTLLVLRMIELVAYLMYTQKLVKLCGKHFIINANNVKQMLMYGGWITVTNIFGPLIVYVDRFIISSVVSINAVAYYVTPTEIITRLMIIPGALSGVMFPAFCASYQSDMQRTAYIFEKALKYTLLLMFPITITIYTFAENLLEMWLGYEFLMNSALILKILVIGALINSLSYIPYALIQASGQPSFIAKQQLYTFPIICVLIYILTSTHGIIGAAMAWTTRTAIDFIILLYKSKKILAAKTATKMIIFTLPVLFCSITLGTFVAVGTSGKILYSMSQVLIFITFFWIFIFEKEEKNFFKKISRRKNRKIIAR